MEHKQSQLGTVFVVAYAVLVIFLVVFSPSGRFDLFWTGGVMLLTFPWSASFLLFAWLLIHDGLKNFLLLPLLFIFASVNAYLLFCLGKKIENTAREWMQTYRKQVK